MAKCPACKQDMNHVHQGDLKVYLGGQVQPYGAIVLACPHCGVAVGVGLDPIALDRESKALDSPASEHVLLPTERKA
jgi:hypothetical protein